MKRLRAVFITVIGAFAFVISLLLLSPLASVRAASTCGLTTTYGMSTLTVPVTQAGSYKIWTRLRAADVTNNAAYLQIDGGQCLKVGGSTSLSTSNWSWVDNGTNSGVQTSLVYNFSAGDHTIVVLGSEPGVQLDRFILMPSSTNCLPSNQRDSAGEPGDNCVLAAVKSNGTPTTGGVIIATTKDGKPIVVPNGKQAVKGDIVLNPAIVNSNSVLKVEYYAGGKLIYTRREKPFYLDTKVLKDGTYQITEKVYYQDGSVTETTKTITIGNSKISTGSIKNLIALILGIVSLLTALVMMVLFIRPSLKHKLTTAPVFIGLGLSRFMHSTSTAIEQEIGSLAETVHTTQSKLVQTWHRFLHVKAFAFVTAFAGIISGYLVFSQAATPSSNIYIIEPENGSLTQGASKVSGDASATLNSFLKFAPPIVIPPPPPPPPPPGPTYYIKTWAPQFQGFGTTGVATDYHPEKFKIVIGDKSIRNQVGYLHSAGVSVLIYLNGSFKNKQDLGPNGNDASYATDYPESSYAHTSSGSRITENDFPANQLMNPLDTTWRNSLYKKCQYYFSQSSYNGCFFDTIGTAPVTASYVSPGLPINTIVNSIWTGSAWLSAINDSIVNVKANLAGKLVYGNGLSNGSRYFGGNNTLMNSLDAAMAEQFAMPKDAGPSDSELDWKKNVDMLVDAASRQKPILAETKAWDGASRAVKDQRHKFALATFLLGANNYTYFNFQNDHTTTSPSTWQGWWGTDFGTPTGAYFKHSSGVYVRNFGKSKAVVNPTTSTITYNLGSSYKAIGTSAPVTSVSLAPKTAEIFIK